MAETRARPARERQRFLQLARANAWFYGRMCRSDDPCWEVMQDWEAAPDSLKIRRFNNANPIDAMEEGIEDLERNPDSATLDPEHPIHSR